MQLATIFANRILDDGKAQTCARLGFVHAAAAFQSRLDLVVLKSRPVLLNHDLELPLRI